MPKFEVGLREDGPDTENKVATFEADALYYDYDDGCFALVFRNSGDDVVGMVSPYVWSWVKEVSE